MGRVPGNKAVVQPRIGAGAAGAAAAIAPAGTKGAAASDMLSGACCILGALRVAMEAPPEGAVAALAAGMLAPSEDKVNCLSVRCTAAHRDSILTVVSCS